MFADGVAVRKVGAETFRLCRDLLDEVITVDTDAMCAAIKDIFDDMRSVAEPSGALALAGLKAYAERGALSEGSLIAVNSGANLRLRPAPHHRRSRRSRRASRSAAGGDRAGEAGQLSALHPHPRLAGHHGIQLPLCRDHRAGAAFVGIALSRGEAEKREVMELLRREGYPILDLSENEMAGTMCATWWAVAPLLSRTR